MQRKKSKAKPNKPRTRSTQQRRDTVTLAATPRCTSKIRRAAKTGKLGKTRQNSAKIGEPKNITRERAPGAARAFQPERSPFQLLSLSKVKSTI